MQLTCEKLNYGKYPPSLGKRPIDLYGCFARGPRLARVEQWTNCLGLVTLFVAAVSHAQALSSVTVGWDSSAASEVAGYRLHYGVTSGSYSSVTDVGNTTKATITGLSQGNTYFIVVTAYDVSGLESVPSNEVAFVAGLKNVADKDFNDDGYADLIWEESTTGQREIWLMSKGVPTTSVNLPTVDPSWHIAGAGDFLGNGQSDLVWERTDGEHLIWILDAGVPQYAINLPTVGGGWHVVGAGDFDNDGQADLVWENSATGQREIWLMKNGMPTTAILLETVDPSWHIAGVGDFLGNGQADLVWENSATGGRVIWLMNNGASTAAINLLTVDPSWHIAGAGNFMGTGQAGLVWENTENGQRLIWVLDHGQPTYSIALPTVPTDWHIVNH
jgi:hypothetical protein